MMNMTKLIVVLCLIGSIMLAGCTLPESEDEAVPEPTVRTYEEGYEQGYRDAKLEYEVREVLEGKRDNRATIDIEEGSYLTWTVNASDEVQLSYRILQYAGPRFDVFVFDSHGLDRFESGEGADDGGDCSDWHTSTGRRLCNLPVGTWHIVLDNTDEGGVAPYEDEYGDSTLRLQFTYEVVRTIQG